MEVILSKHCLSLTGILERGLGYYLQQRNDKRGKPHFYSIRQCGSFPLDGHWRFIVLCAELVQAKLYLSDIRVKREELKQALYEAHGFVAMQHLRLEIYNARDILNLKTTFGL